MSKLRLCATTVRLDQVLNKYWELANLNPDITKGSIAGQLKALDALCVELSAAAEEPKTERPAGVYRAAWMLESGREN